MQEELKAKGVTDVLVYCVNDAAVMGGWAKNQGIEGSFVRFLGDPRSELTQALGLVLDHPGPMSVLGNPRCKRHSMLVDNGTIKTINVASFDDDPPGDDTPDVTLAQKMLEDVRSHELPSTCKAGHQADAAERRHRMEALDEAIAKADVVFFDMPGCPFCRKAEDALKHKGIAFEKIHIGEYRATLKEKTGKTSTPSVWIKKTYVGGCNDGTEPWHGVLPMLANGKFEEMLKGGS